MNRRLEVANGLTYSFNPDLQTNNTSHLRAILRSRLLDELTGLPITSKVSIQTPHQDLQARVGHGGIAGLVGYPTHLFPELNSDAVNLEITLTAKRYIAQNLSATLGPMAGFPAVFTPIDFGDVAMHRAATQIRGRVVQVNAANRDPLDGANITIAGVWPTFPTIDVEPEDVLQAPNLLALATGLYANRTALVDQLRRRVLGFVMGEEKQLVRSLSPNQRTFKISDRINLNTGDLLAIQSNHPELTEYIVIQDINGASTEDQPATITLNYPVHNPHPAGASVVRASLQAQGLNNLINRTGIPGDRSVFCNTLNGLSNSSVIEIIGTGVPEYHAMQLYQNTTDTQGYFRLPPISRVAQLQLEIDHVDLISPQTLDFSPDYELAEQQLNVVIP